MNELCLLLFIASSSQLKPHEFTVLTYVLFNCLQFGNCKLDDKNMVFQIPVKMSKAKINQALSTLIDLNYIECDDFAAEKRTFTMKRILSKIKGK